MKKLTISLFAFLLCTLLAFAQTNPKWSQNITKNISSPSEGQNVTFHAELIVLGTGVANLKVIGGVDGSIKYNHIFPHLNSQAKQSVSFTWQATAGTHTAYFKIDPDNTSGDTNTGNNLTQIQFTVAGSQTSNSTIQKVPDGMKKLKQIKTLPKLPMNLVMKDVFGIVELPQESDWYWSILAEFEIQWKLPNEVDLYFKLTGIGKIVEKTVHLTGPDLKFGTNQNGFLYKIKDLPPGIYVATVTIDPDNLLGEKNRSDNSLTKMISLQAY
jgi:hypothetical protein